MDLPLCTCTHCTLHPPLAELLALHHFTHTRIGSTSPRYADWLRVDNPPCLRQHHRGVGLSDCDSDVELSLDNGFNNDNLLSEINRWLVSGRIIMRGSLSDQAGFTGRRIVQSFSAVRFGTVPDGYSCHHHDGLIEDTVRPLPWLPSGRSIVGTQPDGYNISAAPMVCRRIPYQTRKNWTAASTAPTNQHSRHRPIVLAPQNRRSGTAHQYHALIGYARCDVTSA